MPPIYHITNMRNLPRILEAGGLWCDNGIIEHNITHVSIAHQHIKDRRAVKAVRRLELPGNPVGAGGTLADYVPFYFAPRSPMLYSINGGYVEGYDGGQRSVLHLVSSTDAVTEHELPFAFTDGHAEIAMSDFYDDLQDLVHVDWPLMWEIYWNDTQDDPDKKRRRQAEFLVHRFLPWELVLEIGVISEEIREAVEQVLDRTTSHRPVVNVYRAWYY